MKKRYVCGFCFNPIQDMVLLVMREKQDWQRGLLNGIGGAVEKGETVESAMIREWQEETGSVSPTWTEFAILGGICSDDSQTFEVYFFRSTKDTLLEISALEAGDAKLAYVPVRSIVENQSSLQAVSNLKWLLKMADLSCAHDWRYSIVEKV